MATFSFCPERNVPETLARDGMPMGVSMNGWQFTARPTTPFQRRFKVTLHGLRWYTNPSTGVYDLSTNPTFNAAALEAFYKEHELWKSFVFPHQHIGSIDVRFFSPVNVPAGKQNSAGLIEAFEVMLIEHNPGY